MEKSTFQSLYEQCATYSMRYLSKYTQNIQEAEDVFAEAISIFWIKQKQGKVDNLQNIPAYVFTIAKNLYLSKKKKSIRVEDLDTLKKGNVDLTEEMKIFDEPTEVEILLREGFKKLNQLCQDILTMKYVYKYSYDEIAIQLERNSGDSIKTQSFRCMSKLRRLMKKN